MKFDLAERNSNAMSAETNLIQIELEQYPERRNLGNAHGLLFRKGIEKGNCFIS